MIKELESYKKSTKNQEFQRPYQSRRLFLRVIKKKQSLEINKDWKWVVEGDYVYTRGRVKNVGSRTISYFEVYCEYCDENGNVLDTDYTNSGLALYPNNEKEFEIMHKDNPEYKKVRVFVDNIVYE